MGATRDSTANFRGGTRLLVPQRSNEFQRLIVRIEAALGGDAATVTESAQLPERDGGTLREVDILVEGVINRTPIRVAIETRDHGRAQSVEWIDRLIGKYRDLPVDRIVAVSRSGFSEAAKVKAGANRISAVDFAEALAADWEAEFRAFFPKAVAVRFWLRDVGVQFRRKVPPVSAPTLAELGDYVLLDSHRKELGHLKDAAPRMFRDHLESRAAQYVDQHAAEFFDGAEPRSETLHADVEVTMLLADNAGSIYEVDYLHFVVGASIDFLSMDARRSRYKDALVTRAAVEHKGNKLEFEYVQVPDDDGVRVMLFEVHPGQEHKATKMGFIAECGDK